MERIHSSGNKVRRHQSGQILIEMVLLGVVLIGLLSMGVRVFREKKIIQNITQGPWETTSGMIESGVWGTPAETRPNHPNTMNRMLSNNPTF
ncbi:MAG: hypothetical protein ACK5P5_12230 [Pseudobdellovibrionaceae bacterium]